MAYITRELERMFLKLNDFSRLSLIGILEFTEAGGITDIVRFRKLFGKVQGDDNEAWYERNL